MRPGPAVPHVVGALTAFAGVAMLLPAAVSFSYLESDGWWILASALAAIVVGVGMNRAFRLARDVTIRDGFAIVTGGWVSVAFFGSLPYFLTGSIDSFSGAFFESMSGLTTTGATVVTDIDALSHGVLLWRSLTQWLGGMGIIVLSVAILPFLGVGGMQLMQAEIPGLAPDRLRPRVRQTASLLWAVYALLTALEIALLWAGPMNLFEAVNHGFTTMATGGFSTEDASIGAFESRYVEYVVGIFVVLAGINFTLHYSALTGRWGAIRRNTELRVYLMLLAGATAALTLMAWLPGRVEGFEPAFRAAFFQAASIMTTTGFATADYELWLPAAQTLLFLLMLIGACAGSTSGSVKVLRHVLVFKEARVSLKRLLHPSGVFVYKMDGRSVGDDVLANVSGFLLLYMGLLGVGVLALNLLGSDAATAIGAAASTLGNIGPGFGAVGPSETYAGFGAPSLWVLDALMLIGRLEIFTVLVLFTRGYWRA